MLVRTRLFSLKAWCGPAHGGHSHPLGSASCTPGGLTGLWDPSVPQVFYLLIRALLPSETLLAPCAFSLSPKHPDRVAGTLGNRREKGLPGCTLCSLPQNQ